MTRKELGNLHNIECNPYISISRPVLLSLKFLLDLIHYATMLALMLLMHIPLPTPANMVIFIVARPPDRRLGYHIGIPRLLVRSFEARGVDVPRAATTGGVGTITLVASGALTDDFAVHVGVAIRGYIASTTATVGGDGILVRRGHCSLN